MTWWVVLILVVLNVLLWWIIDLGMERRARKQTRRRMQGLPYVNFPGVERHIR